MELLASILEFDYDYVLSEDNKFGSPEANGTWNGLIKMLLEGVCGHWAGVHVGGGGGGWQECMLSLANNHHISIISLS